MYCIVLFYKIVHVLVAIPLPTYVIPHNRYSRTTYPLAFRQLYARTDYYKYSFFLLAVVQWNNLSARTATLTNLDSFKLVPVRSATSDHKCIHHCFYPHFFMFLLFNTLTLRTFILFSLSALFLTLTFIACCGEPGT